MESSGIELPEEVKQPSSQKTETTPLKQVPEPNAIKGLEGWFYKLRMITRSNRQINPELRELPLAERTRRATLYKALEGMKQNPQIKTISIPNASHAYPTIAPDIVIPKVFIAQAQT